MLYKSEVKTDFPAFVDITDELKKAVVQSGVKAGACVVTVSDPESALGFMETDNEAARIDVQNELNTLFPPRIDYSESENPYICAARTKSALLSTSRSISILDGKPAIGEGRSLYIVDFVGKKTLEFYIKCI